MIWIVSPKYAQTAILWRMLKKFLPKSYVKDIKEGDMVLSFDFDKNTNAIGKVKRLIISKHSDIYIINNKIK